jgi:hypothetical protein
MRRPVAVALAAAVASVAAQDPPALDATRVRDLLVLIAAPDPRGALDAARELEQLGPGVAPALVETLKKDDACQVQWVVSGILSRLKLEPALVEATLVGMARGTCRASSVAGLNLQQDAALALIDRPSGIALLTPLLRDRDPLVRRRAAWALDVARKRDTATSQEPVEARRDSLASIIARLDRQPPELAAQTTSALVAANEDVVPLLRQRLQGTDSCRGLTLVAGILAGRNTADADVEATFSRVAAGKCEGREPFDLVLAQSAADALLARAAGVTRLTGLLTDRDVAVRRRAARALATLFDRLGMGEAGRPESDQALLDAARAAVAPLVTLATTERDEAARCQGVRAILRAQQAMHDAIRAEADRASTGRTLRCLAPPNP